MVWACRLNCITCPGDHSPGGGAGLLTPPLPRPITPNGGEKKEKDRAQDILLPAASWLVHHEVTPSLPVRMRLITPAQTDHTKWWREEGKEKEMDRAQDILLPAASWLVRHEVTPASAPAPHLSAHVLLAPAPCTSGLPADTPACADPAR